MVLCPETAGSASFMTSSAADVKGESPPMLKSPTWPYPRAHGLPLPCASLNNRVRGGQVVASLKWHLTQYGAILA